MSSDPRRVVMEALEARRLMAVVPSGFADQQLVGGLASPTAMTVAPDGRIFVAEQGGKLRVVKDGQLLAAPFATVPTKAVGERGLLGVALDPSFASNGLVYAYYTENGSVTRNKIVRWKASGDVAAGAPTTLLELDPLSGATNHNGGAMHFGDDGKLYVAVGDNAKSSNATSLGTLHGKMLRLNADGSVPSDNPFAGSASGKNRAIWATGLRNPFTFALSPKTGRMFINDVGQASFEEVNDGLAGADYGWPATEGYHDDPAYERPLHAYGRSVGRSIAGGAFYDAAAGTTLGGAAFPSSFRGDYFFADFVTGFINTLDVGGSPSAPQYDAKSFATGVNQPVDVDVAADGSLLYLSRGSGATTGAVGRIRPTASQAPTISQQPQSRTVGQGESVVFSVAANGPGTLAYQWQRNGKDVAGATAPVYTLKSASSADDGAAFRVRVSNAAGSVLSAAATLDVLANQAPTATIASPKVGTTVAGGQTISFGGAATDPEDGTLPASAYTWRVEYVTGGQVRPFVAPFSGKAGGAFTAHVETPYTQPDVFYRVHLTVTDSAGLSRATFRDVTARTSKVTLRAAIVGPASAPDGAFRLTLDGQPFAAPFSFVGVEGVRRTFGAPSPQTIDGVTYRFANWSDGGGASHDVLTPAADGVYYARFAADPPATVGKSLVPLADATVRDGASRGANFGYGPLMVKQDGGTAFDRAALFKFDLAGLPAGGVNKATLRLTGRQHMAGRPPTVVAAYGSTGTSWTEGGVTWSNQPPATTGVLDTAAVAGTSGGIYEMDVTGFIKSQLAAGRTATTLVLRGVGDNEAIAVFDAGSSPGGPRLVIA